MTADPVWISALNVVLFTINFNRVCVLYVSCSDLNQGLGPHFTVQFQTSHFGPVVPHGAMSSCTAQIKRWVSVSVRETHRVWNKEHTLEGKHRNTRVWLQLSTHLITIYIYISIELFFTSPTVFFFSYLYVPVFPQSLIFMTWRSLIFRCWLTAVHFVILSINCESAAMP